MFWSDINRASSTIVRMSMDASNYAILVDKDVLTIPNGLSLDYENETLYWINAETLVIGSIRTDGTQEE